MKTKILYVEDEKFLAKIVKETLELKNYEVLHLTEGTRIDEYLERFNPDICILDVMLPNKDGFSIGSYIHQHYPHLPVIFLTAKTQTADIIKGFASGGTDYLKKPFSMEELMVRIENQLRIKGIHTGTTDTIDEEIILGHTKFYPALYELHKNGSVIKLSNRESQVLGQLSAHRNKTIERKQLLNAVWGDDSFFNSRNLDVYIRKLRGHLKDEDAVEIITLKGIGYRFVVK
ncbi:MAG: response regulator transcription factor [Chitinophagales bacterium]|nr:response regulator transcription factor [Chitinophagales bacterium]